MTPEPKPPIHCHPQAWQELRAQIERIESNDGLLGAAMAIARHADPGLSEDHVRFQLGELVRMVRERSSGMSARAVLAHAHVVLFDEIGFRGDLEDYFDPRNSFLHEVLRRRRGLPITLALIYKLVVEASGDLVVHGVNAPGHFLVRVESSRPGLLPLLVDPFHGGRVLSTVEALEQVRALVGEVMDRRSDPLALASHRDWVLRMLRNLVGVYHERRQHEHRAAMEELVRVLW